MSFFIIPEKKPQPPTTMAELEAGLTNSIGLKRKVAEAWGIPWPLKRGWRKELERQIRQGEKTRVKTPYEIRVEMQALRKKAALAKASYEPRGDWDTPQWRKKCEKWLEQNGGILPWEGKSQWE
jgi:transposase-like protein